MSNDTTSWKDVPGFEGFYRINVAGDIMRVKAGMGAKVGRVLKARIDINGYGTVYLYHATGRLNLRIHRLVLLAFEGACPPDCEVNHKNGIKTDNRLENLEYITHQENIQHAANAASWAKKGEGSHYAKLTEERVRELRQLYATGKFLQMDLARQFGISTSQLRRIVKRTAWTHI